MYGISTLMEQTRQCNKDKAFDYVRGSALLSYVINCLISNKVVVQRQRQPLSTGSYP